MNDTRPTPPAAVGWITRTLEDAGYETWAVGGAVRDALLGHSCLDWDLATRATPRQLRKLFRRTVPIGISHGTVGILARDGTLYEVTTFRKDIETDGRHAVVEFSDSIADDLARRDFTINAIAWHVLRKEFHDPFGGAEDLERGLLRTVGVPNERFREDYLRILRALRFAGRFDLEIEEATWSAMRALASHLPSLSQERIRDELMKVLGSDPHPLRALQLYAESGALGVLYAELELLREATVPESEEQSHGEAWAVRLAGIERLPTGRAELRLVALLRGLEPNAVVALVTRLRFSNALTDEIVRLTLAAPMPGETESDADVRRWLSVHGVGGLPTLARLELARARGVFDRGGPANCDSVVEAWNRARRERRMAPPLAVGDLEMDGRGLIALGLRPGPGFGDILEELLAFVLEDPSRNQRASLEQRVSEITRRDAHDV